MLVSKMRSAVKGLVPRLLLLVLMALLPVLAFEIYTEWNARQVRQHIVEKEALRYVRTVNAQQRRIFDGAEQVLDTLVATNAVRNDRRPGCERILTALLQQSPRYIDISVIGLDGHSRCATSMLMADTDFSDIFCFREALRTGGFVVGDYATGRAVAVPTIYLAKPFRSADGTVQGVAMMGLNLAWLGEELGSLPFPPGTVAVITDRNATVLAHFPDEPGRVGAKSNGVPQLAGGGDGVHLADMVSRDGLARLAAYSPPTAASKGQGAIVALDRNAIFAPVTQANRMGFLLIVAGAALAAVVTAVLGNALIHRPFRRLLAVADRWRDGQLSVRSGLPADSSEFGRLGSAFDAMATALAAREHALAMALESTMDSVVVLDRDWRVTFLNGRAKASIARDRNLLGQTIWDALPMLAGCGFGTALRTAMEQAVPTSGFVASRTFGKDFEAHAYPSSDGLTVFLRDVTEERRTVASLQEREALLRAIGNCSADPIYAKDAEGRFLFANPAVLAVLGKPAEQVIGHTDAELHDDAAQVAAVMANDQRIIATGQAEVVEEAFDAAGQGKRVFRSAKAPLRTEGGQAIGVVGMSSDITQIKGAEVALRESRSMLQAALASMTDAVCISDTEGRFVEFNEAFATFHRFRNRTECSRTLLEYPQAIDVLTMNDEPAPFGLWAVSRALQGEMAINAEYRMRRKDTGETWMASYNFAPIRNEAGTIIGSVVVGRDITERKRIEATLHKLNSELEGRVADEVAAREAAQARAVQAERMQALGQLAGGIAHDFNNVLQAVQGAAALIDRRPHDEAGIRRLARMVIEAADRGASTTRRLLAFGRRSDLRAEPLDVAAMLSGMREIFAHTLGVAIEVEVQLADDMPPVLADKGQLETALVNLGTNARDAMRSGGRLTLAARAEIVPADSRHPLGLVPGRYVGISFADTGTGMDAATLARAVDPFFTTKAVGAGTGLGLPMVRGFAEQSGGALNIASSPGHGTTVTLYLPTAEPVRPEAVVQPPEMKEAPAEVAKPATRLLLVDDEDLLREVLAEQLETAGYRVLVAANGTEALALLAVGEAVDALITDLSMPDVDGLAVIRGAQDRYPGLPAVLLTGYAGDGAALAVAGLVAGSFSLLRKPIQLHELTDRLEALLAAGQKAGGAGA